MEGYKVESKLDWNILYKTELKNKRAFSNKQNPPIWWLLKVPQY